MSIDIDGHTPSKKELSEVFRIAFLHLDKLEDYAIILKDNINEFGKHIDDDDLRDEMFDFFRKYSEMKDESLDPVERRFEKEIQKWEEDE